MQNETFTTRQAVCTMILFIFGSSLVLGVNTGSGQDSWIACLLGMVLAIPMVLVYSRIIKICPRKDIFEILIELFGKFAGKIIVVIITIYFIHLGAIIIRNFSEFNQVSVMPETPQLPIRAIIILVAIYFGKSGIDTLGRGSILILATVVSVVVLTILLSLKDWRFSNLFPIMGTGTKQIFCSSLDSLTFPFCETVAFLGIANSFKKCDKPHKIFLYSVLIGGFVLALVAIRNICILGSYVVDTNYFPSYSAARIIALGNFLTRVEGTISINFILSGLVKITICLIAASRGFAKIFQIENYKNMIIPVGMVMITLSGLLYGNIFEMMNFINIYIYYVIPFQFLIPIIVWITAEIKSKSKKKKLTS